MQCFKPCINNSKRPQNSFHLKKKKKKKKKNTHTKQSKTNKQIHSIFWNKTQNWKKKQQQRHEATNHADTADEVAPRKQLTLQLKLVFGLMAAKGAGTEFHKWDKDRRNYLSKLERNVQHIWIYIEWLWNRLYNMFSILFWTCAKHELLCIGKKDFYKENVYNYFIFNCIAVPTYLREKEKCTRPRPTWPCKLLWPSDRGTELVTQRSRV